MTINNQLEKVEFARFSCPQNSNHLVSWLQLFFFSLIDMTDNFGDIDIKFRRSLEKRKLTIPSQVKIYLSKECWPACWPPNIRGLKLIS